MLPEYISQPFLDRGFRQRLAQQMDFHLTHNLLFLTLLFF